MAIEHLRAKSTSLQIRGILELITHGVATEAEKSALSDLTASGKIIGGRKVSQYAIAAQNNLGIKEYVGDDPYVLDLIQDMSELVSS